MLPVLRNNKSSKEILNTITQFAGLNRGLNISDNEFSDMVNMTSDYFPVFGNRRKRGIINTLTKPQAVCGGDKLSYIDDDVLYYDSTAVLNLSAGGERELVMMGAYLCVFPDGIVYNTLKGTHESIENEIETSTTVTMTLCDLSGTEYTSSNTYTGTTAPSDTTQYSYWIDTSQPDDVILKMWSDSYQMWTTVATTYVKIASTGIGSGFKDYDSAKFSGITIKGYNNYEFNDTLIIYKATTNYLIVAGLINMEWSQGFSKRGERLIGL
jgi:hypothetical protein